MDAFDTDSLVMEQTQLSLVTKDAAIELPGCKLTSTGVEFEASVTKGNLRDLGIALQKVEGCRAWWWGDWVVKMRELNGNIAADFVEASGMKLGTLWKYSEISEFYPTRTRVRVQGLTHKHYRLAKFAAGSDLDVALGWLKQAVDNNWTTAQMNRAIRDAKAIEQDPSIVHHYVAPADKMKAALAANMWAGHALQVAESWDKTRIEAVLDSIPELVGLIDLLRQRLEEASRKKPRTRRAQPVDDVIDIES